jgi:hypothetical protein
LRIGSRSLLRGGLPQRGMHKSSESNFIEATLVLPERCCGNCG